MKFKLFGDKPVAAEVKLPPERTEFFSPFGGFWTDLRNSEDMLEGKRALGLIDADEQEMLRSWMRNGYVILRGALDEQTVDAVSKDIDIVVQQGHPSSKVCYWKEGTKYIETPVPEHMREAEAKLLDMHMLSDAARQAIYSPRLLRFLNLVFERTPLAFQSLAFELGSQQPVHCDVAFVHVSSPREFVASWIALEDIEPGSGELEYYPGSHRLADHLFAGESPWVQGDPVGYEQQLAEYANAANLNLERFLPKKGDVLFWNAGLYHGGSRRDTGNTRKSLVTHYCPIDRRPMYADSADRYHKTPYGGYVAGCFPPIPETV